MNRRSFLKAMLGGAVAMSAGGIALLEAEPIQRAYFLPPRGGWANRASWELVLAQESLLLLDEKLARFGTWRPGLPLDHAIDSPMRLQVLEGVFARHARAKERVEKLLKGWVPPARAERVLGDGTRVLVSGGRSRSLRPSDLGPDALPWDPKAGWRAV